MATVNGCDRILKADVWEGGEGGEVREGRVG